MKKIFFYLLFIYFINSYCYAENRDIDKNFITPLVLADYDSGIFFTNTGGLFGGDEEKPGTTHIASIPDDNFARGNSGYSLMLEYDVSNLGEFSFYWVKLGKQDPVRPERSATLDLRKYNYLSFWIKGENTGQRLKIELHEDADNNGVFVFGNDITSYLYASSYVEGGLITDEWKKVIIPLKDFSVINNWENLHELVFVFENRTGIATGKIYIDDILFGWRPLWVLESHETEQLKAPREETFKVNGVEAEQCLALGSKNIFHIKAESIKNNPYIESVRFEYSTDGGNIWRVIGRDYDVSKNGYEVEWMPDNGAQIYNYQIRAVATDIKGNQSATGALLDCPIKPLTDEEFLDLVEKNAFKFFYDHQNAKTGLFADTSGGGDASIASTGLGVAVLCVGAERGWIDTEEARRRVDLALDAFIPRVPENEPLAEGKYGFFYHFLNMHTGKRAGKAEISTVDTAILVCGALTAGEYFGGDIKKKAEIIYENVEWGKFLNMEMGPWYGTFSMGWSPERGFLESYWDYYTDEVIMVALLAIGSPTHPVDPGVFYAWTRHEGTYGDIEPFIYTWHGALFSYQYAQIWFDFRNLVDKDGVNWFQNSVNATLANRQFCIDNQDVFKTYGPNTWGVTSMDRPAGYTMHFGVPPCGSGEPHYDATISPTGPAGSIVFTPYLSLSALKYMYLTYPRLWGKYGIKDSYNLDLNWYAPTYYGIGVAMMVLPIENFRSGLVWEYFMKNEHVQEALKKAGFQKVRN